MFAVGFRTDLFLIATDNATCYEVVANRYHDVRTLYRQHRKQKIETRIDGIGVVFAAFSAGVSVGALLMLTAGGLYLG